MLIFAESRKISMMVQSATKETLLMADSK